VKRATSAPAPAAVGKPAEAAKPAAGAKPADADKAIREAAQRFTDAFNTGDSKAVASLWADDGEYVDEAGEHTSGRAAIQARYAQFLTANPGAKLDVIVDSVKQIAPDSAIEEGHSTFTPAAEPHTASSGRYTAVHVLRDGKWQIASIRDLTSEPTAQGDPLSDLDWLIGTWHAEHLGAEMEITCCWLADKSFVELSYARREGDKVTPTATQILGRDPRSGQIATWMFSADKGYAQGILKPHGSGWAMEFEGARADGTPTAAVNILSRVNDALVWKSTQRMIGNDKLPDTEEVVLKRK
jgi:uncharacterized protein (TIGR02246 family)